VFAVNRVAADESFPEQDARFRDVALWQSAAPDLLAGNAALKFANPLDREAV
jgi:hypothetical protein